MSLVSGRCVGLGPLTSCERGLRAGRSGLSTSATGRSLLDDLARFANGRGGPLAVFLWALAEAIALPVIPDVLLGLLLLAAPRRFVILFASLCLGSLAGSLVLYALTMADPGGPAGTPRAAWDRPADGDCGVGDGGVG